MEDLEAEEFQAQVMPEVQSKFKVSLDISVRYCVKVKSGLGILLSNWACGQHEQGLRFSAP